MKQRTIFDLVQDELITVETEVVSAINFKKDLMTNMASQLHLPNDKFLNTGLYLLCARSSRENITEKISVAVSINLIHMANLVHHNILDSTMVRRGVTGNSRLGNPISILTGDYLYSKAFLLISKASTMEVLKIITDIICLMCEGEIKQLYDRFNPNKTEEEYLISIRQKNASFMAASCKLGAIVAKLDINTIEVLHQYGYAIGAALQIKNDILGSPVPKPKQSIGRLYQHSTIESAYQQIDKNLELARKCIPNSLANDVREALFEVIDFIGARKNSNVI